MTVLIVGLVAIATCIVGIFLHNEGIVYISGFVGAFVVVAGLIQLHRERDEP